MATAIVNKQLLSDEEANKAEANDKKASETEDDEENEHESARVTSGTRVTISARVA